MSIEINFPFDDAAGLIFDPAKVEVTGGKLGLVLGDALSQNFIEDFADDTDFVYDSDLAEFSAGSVQQINKRPADATLYVPYTNDENAVWGDGNLTGTLTGSPAVTGGYLDLSGGLAQYADYDAALNVDGLQTGCIRIRFRKMYDGAPNLRKWFFCVSEIGTVRNYIDVYHGTGGVLHVRMFNSNGVLIFEISGSWVPGIGDYEFELNYDLTTGENRVFINGTQFSSTNMNTGARSANIDLLRMGTNFNATEYGDYLIYDVLIFSAVQHTANYTPDWSNIYELDYIGSKVDLPQFAYSGLGSIRGFSDIATVEGGTPKWIMNGLWYNGGWVASTDNSESNSISEVLANIDTLPASDTMNVSIIFEDGTTQSNVDSFDLEYAGQAYATDNPTVEITTTWYVEELLAFFSAVTAAGGDAIRYNLRKGATWNYFDGGVLTETDGNTYAEASLASEIETFKADYTSEKVLFGVRIFLHSETGATTPLLDLLSIQYDFAGDTPDTLDKCIVWGYNKDSEGNGNTNPVKVFLSENVTSYKSNTMVLQRVVTVTPQSDGYWEVELIENENMEEEVHYIFQMDGISYPKLVPNEATKSFVELENYDGK